jgi:hypothetical protein
MVPDLGGAFRLLFIAVFPNGKSGEKSLTNARVGNGGSFERNIVQ